MSLPMPKGVGWVGISIIAVSIAVVVVWGIVQAGEEPSISEVDQLELDLKWCQSQAGKCEKQSVAQEEKYKEEVAYWKNWRERELAALRNTAAQAHEVKKDCEAEWQEKVKHWELKWREESNAGKACLGKLKRHTDTKKEKP